MDGSKRRPRCQPLTTSLAGDGAGAARGRETAQAGVHTPLPSGNADCGELGVDRRLAAVGGTADQWGRSARLPPGR